MKYLRMTVTPDAEAVPAAFGLLADSRHVDEARLLGVNYADTRGITGLFALDGDREGFLARVADVPELVHVEVARVDGERFYLLATISTEAGMIGAVFETLTRDGLVVLKPVHYRDGSVHARLVGETVAVQRAVTTFPDAMSLEVNEIGRHGVTAESAAATLSERQREAVRSAIDVGYYDTPRRATHEDVATRLGCAPSTASEHLQKAEAKLVQVAMTEAGVPGTDSPNW